MTKTQQEFLDEFKNELINVANEYVKMEAADCDEITKDKVRKAFFRGFYIGIQAFNTNENKE